MTTFERNIFKVENEPQTMGRILVVFDFLAEQSDFLYTKGRSLAELSFLIFIEESWGEINITENESFGLILGPPIWPPEHIFRLF